MAEKVADLSKCRQQLEKMKNTVTCSKCAIFSLAPNIYSACGHVICQSCHNLDKPSEITICPICLKKTTDMPVKNDPFAIKFTALTDKLTKLFDRLPEIHRAGLNLTNENNAPVENTKLEKDTSKVASNRDVQKVLGGAIKKIRIHPQETLGAKGGTTAVSGLNKNVKKKRMRLSDKSMSTKPPSSGAVQYPQPEALDDSKTMKLSLANNPVCRTLNTGRLGVQKTTLVKQLANTDDMNGNLLLEKQDESKCEAQSSLKTPVRHSKVMENEFTTPKSVSSPRVPKTEKRNERGETVLHMACIRGDVDKVKSLISEGAEVNVLDHARWTPLHEAANQGLVEMAQCLISAGAMINVPGGNNITPLHDAVVNNRIEMVEMLVQLGADIKARDSQGKTPRDLAVTSTMRAALTSKKLPTTKLASTANLSPVVNRHMVIYAGALTQQATLKTVANLLKLKLVGTLTRDVTHVVMETYDNKNACRSSVLFLNALLLGKTIINHDWMVKCQEEGCFIDPLLFEVSGTTSFPESHAAQRARRNAQNQLPGLWDGCKFFFRSGTYVAGDLKLSKSELWTLVRAGGGRVVSREPNPENITDAEKVCPYHAKPDSPLSECAYYIVYQPGDEGIKYNMPHIKCLPLQWLLDSIETFTIRDHVPYMP